MASFDEFYSDSKLRRIKIIQAGEALTIGDLYEKYICQYINVDKFRKMNNLIIEYANEDNAIFFVRKYESTCKIDDKGKKQWDNRRGAITIFKDGFEYVFTSNFVAKNFMAMSINGIDIDKNEFKKKIIDKSYPLIISTTAIERKIIGTDSYKKSPSAMSGKRLYLAHIEDVNGRFLRNDGCYKEIERGDEHSRIYPKGNVTDWANQEHHIRRLDYILTDEEKALVKAHFIRFMSPLNYFITPATKYSTQGGKKMTENIGENTDIKMYMMKKYKDLFGDDYLVFLKVSRVQFPNDDRSLDELAKIKINIKWN